MKCSFSTRDFCNVHLLICQFYICKSLEVAGIKMKITFGIFFFEKDLWHTKRVKEFHFFCILFVHTLIQSKKIKKGTIKFTIKMSIIMSSKVSIKMSNIMSIKVSIKMSIIMSSSKKICFGFSPRQAMAKSLVLLHHNTTR